MAKTIKNLKTTSEMVNTLLSTPSSDHLLVPYDRIQPLRLQLLLELVDEVVGLRVHLLIVVVTLRHHHFSIPFPHIRRSTKAILVLLVYVDDVLITRNDQ